jgi:hypothetical protein
VAGSLPVWSLVLWSGKRVSAFAKDGEITPIAEHAPASAARYFLHHTEPFQVGKRSVDRRRSKARTFNEQVDREEWILLKQVMDAQGRSGPLAVRLPICILA